MLEKDEGDKCAGREKNEDVLRRAKGEIEAYCISLGNGKPFGRTHFKKLS